MSKGRECQSGKKPYRTQQLAAFGARRMAMQLNARGAVVEPVYSYLCTCGALHLTRLASFLARPNFTTFTPVHPDLQLALMTAEARTLHERRLAARLAREEATMVTQLPDPLPKPAKQPYANRPRGLRYRK